jgi:hypothetical protein
MCMCQATIASERKRLDALDESKLLRRKQKLLDAQAKRDILLMRQQLLVPASLGVAHEAAVDAALLMPLPTRFDAETEYESGFTTAGTAGHYSGTSSTDDSTDTEAR